jgi:hypothetical protein
LSLADNDVRQKRLNDLKLSDRTRHSPYSLIFEVFSFSIQHLIQIFRCKSIKSFLQLLQNFDKNLKVLGIFINHKKYKVVAYFAVYFLIVTNSFAFVILPFIYDYFGFIGEFNKIVASAYAYTMLYKLFYSVQLALANFALGSFLITLP